MGKRLTYEQRVRRKFPMAILGIGVAPSGFRFYVLVRAAKAPLFRTASRPRDAWRSAWRNLRRKK